MKRFVVVCLLLSPFYAIDAQATDWYVRSGAGGTGTSWTNAWSDVAGISWASIAPGDTIWIAGGTYGTLTLGKSGNADTVPGRLFIKRATVAAHGTGTGWSAGYDKQVVLGKIIWSTLNVGSYVTIDGQQTSGILIYTGVGNATSGITVDRGNSYITLRYLDLAGPCGAVPCVQGGDNRGIDTTAWNGSSFEPVDHFLVQYNKIHGYCSLFFLMNADDSIVEHNELYDNHATDLVPCHPNVVATSQSNNMTFRNNTIYNYGVEGIMMIFGDSGTWYIYGNLWYGGGPSAGPYNRILESQDGTNGPVYFYNNTVVDMWKSWSMVGGGFWHASTASKNNIYWNSPGTAPSNQAHDFCSGTCGGSNSISTGSNPFVNLSGGNLHIVSAVGATHPKDKGINLGLPYNVDMDGILRGGDSTWDIGAYEYVSGDTVPPNPPTGLRIQ